MTGNDVWIQSLGRRLKGRVNGVDSFTFGTYTVASFVAASFLTAACTIALCSEHDCLFIPYQLNMIVELVRQIGLIECGYRETVAMLR